MVCLHANIHTVNAKKALVASIESSHGQKIRQTKERVKKAEKPAIPINSFRSVWQRDLRHIPCRPAPHKGMRESGAPPGSGWRSPEQSLTIAPTMKRRQTSNCNRGWPQDNSQIRRKTRRSIAAIFLRKVNRSQKRQGRRRYYRMVRKFSPGQPHRRPLIKGLKIAWPLKTILTHKTTTLDTTLERKWKKVIRTLRVATFNCKGTKQARQLGIILLQYT